MKIKVKYRRSTLYRHGYGNWDGYGWGFASGDNSGVGSPCCDGEG